MTKASNAPNQMSIDVSDTNETFLAHENDGTGDESIHKTSCINADTKYKSIRIFLFGTWVVLLIIESIFSDYMMIYQYKFDSWFLKQAVIIHCILFGYVMMIGKLNIWLNLQLSKHMSKILLQLLFICGSLVITGINLFSFIYKRNIWDEIIGIIMMDEIKLS